MKVENQITKGKENEKGAAMIMALLVSFLLLTASAGLLLESSMNAANVTDAVAEQQAYHAAESGIQSAVHVLRCQKNSNPGCADIVATPRIEPTASPPHPLNQINYSTAVDPLTAHTTDQDTDVPRLSRWLNYTVTCGSDDGLCVALYQRGED
jgi:Tfp pilus assembly protein PilX